MNWTTPADLRAQVQRLWDRGLLPAELAGGESLFPRRISLKKPTSVELVDHFDEVRQWIARLVKSEKNYRLVWRTINHRTLGANRMPVQAWIDTLDDALRLIGRTSEAERFAAQVTMTRTHRPELLAWMKQRPLRALDIADDWPKLLSVVKWMTQHARPEIYLRQVDLPGIHSKFIETHRATLGELFDLVLPQEAIDSTAAQTVSGFCRRYGFRDKPVKIRFRLLDPHAAVFATGSDQDITVTHDTFARLDLPVNRVYITENEINFLCFPPVPNGMVIFGAGYGFDMLAQAEWLHHRRIYYWGDIDTHGFAILDQLRNHFPAVTSFLMDRETLMAHQTLWGKEPTPENRDLPRLDGEERKLYDDLRHNRLGQRIRLEQEHIGYQRACENLKD